MKKKDYRSLAYVLAQAVGLVEEEEPTEKDLEKIKKEKAPKIPKKKYFGGATRPEDVDTDAAIASHAAKIKAAGQAGVKKAQDKRDAEDRAAENQSTELQYDGSRVDEIIGAALGTVGKIVKTGVDTTGKVAGAGAKAVGKVAKTGLEIPGKVVGAVVPEKKKAVLAHTAYSQLGQVISELLGGVVDDADKVMDFSKKHSPLAKAGRTVKGTAKKGLDVVTGTVGAAGKAVGNVAKGAGEGLGGNTKEKKTIVVSHTESPENGSMVSEYAMLAGTAVRALGGTALRRGAVAGGRKAAVGGTGRKVAAGARKLAKNPEAMETLAQGAEQGVDALKKRKANKLAAEAEPEPTEDSTQYNNAYVKSLMETMAGKGDTAEARKADRERANIDRLARRAETPKPTRASKKTRGVSSHGKVRKPEETQQNSWTEYHRMGKLFMEWEAGPTAKRIAAKSPGGEGSRMSDQGDKPVSRDKLVDRETKKTVANVEKKLGGAKTNMKTADAVQGSMNRRRKESRARGEGIPTVDRGSKFGKSLSRAEGEEDKKKLAGPSG